jgi:hypothetical protein
LPDDTSLSFSYLGDTYSPIEGNTKMITQDTHRSASTRSGRRLAVVALVPLFGVFGLAACSDEVDDLVAVAQYVGASADVLEANDMEPEFDIDCEGSDATNDVTCTGQTEDGLDIVSTGENLGADDATLTVTVDGKVLYDGLLDETP